MNKTVVGETVYSDAEVVAHLTQQLERWELKEGHLCRCYKTSGWKSTLMVVNTVGHLAEVAWHHPDLEVSYSHVVVKLTSHSAKGITAKDFELAQKIEETVLWRPDQQNSALKGTPDDPRFAYMVYEET